MKTWVNMGTAERLRLLADWFDWDDAQKGKTGTEVQDFLRGLAEEIAQVNDPTHGHPEETDDRVLDERIREPKP